MLFRACLYKGLANPREGQNGQIRTPDQHWMDPCELFGTVLIINRSRPQHSTTRAVVATSRTHLFKSIIHVSSGTYALRVTIKSALAYSDA